MIRVAPEIQEEIIRLYLEDRRSQKSLADEFGLTVHVVRRIVTNYRKECQEDQERTEKLNVMEENGRLKKQVEELQKENDFLKKAAAFFAKETS